MPFVENCTYWIVSVSDGAYPPPTTALVELPTEAPVSVCTIKSPKSLVFPKVDTVKDSILFASVPPRLNAISPTPPPLGTTFPVGE